MEHWSIGVVRGWQDFVLVLVLDWAHFLDVFSKDRQLRSPQTRIGLSDQYLSTFLSRTTTRTIFAPIPVAPSPVSWIPSQ
jgi:hypothetical protein